MPDHPQPQARTGVPLRWTGEAGYKCPHCSLYVTLTRRAWAACPRCPSIPVNETAALLLAHAGLDEPTVTDAVAALRPLLDALASQPAPAQPHPKDTR